MTALRVTFEDLGQAFLWWEIDPETGHVIGCGPGQAWLWADGRVSVDLATIQVGQRPRYFSPAQPDRGAVLRHAIAAIESAPNELIGGGVFHDH